MGNISSAFPIVGGIINSISGAVQQANARKWQEKMVDKQNKWNLQQWRRQNEYNSPVNQMQRMKLSGMNPDLAVAAGYTNMTDAQLTSASPGSPAMGNLQGVGQGLAQAGQMMQQQELIDANAAKTRSETEGINIDNLYRAAEHKASIETKWTSVAVGESVVDLNKQQGAVCVKQLDKMDKDIAEIDQRISNLRASERFTDVQSRYYAAKTENERYALLNQLATSALERGLISEKTKSIFLDNKLASALFDTNVQKGHLENTILDWTIENMQWDVKNKSVDNEIKRELKRGIYWDNETKKFNCELLKKYGEGEKQLDMLNKAAGCVRECVGIVSDFQKMILAPVQALGGAFF